jgi:hypothetical protein
VFDLPPACLSDPDAPTNRSTIGIDGLALCRCESSADEASKRAACKAVGEHDHFGGPERTGGEQSEGSTLFSIDVGLSRRCRHSVLPFNDHVETLAPYPLQEDRGPASGTGGSHAVDITRERRGIPQAEKCPAIRYCESVAGRTRRLGPC